ncbi:ComEA family DNA-binding protein [Arthrobacter sp. MI7-26]|uniref:ComEA family DNA-binding protein n=1 Tax=Arthrobacter sp. MI7-26 TaxID=2993653 RepID=UPI0022495C23|nr:ComEA family DNA-binding protein [Arthrobacter sp. MI7-26]MCX2746694.1 ComEA family DNA-binding protein [Arthrobacter sp. MI7-26]
MPRRNGAASANDAANAARRRFTARLGPPLAGEHSAELGGAGQVELQRGHDGRDPLLPLHPLLEGNTGTSPSGYSSGEPDSGDSGVSGESLAPPRLRWRTPRRVAVLLTVPCLLLLLWFAWQAWTAQPTVEPMVRSSLAGAAPRVGGSTAQDDSPESRRGQLTVHVAGAVKNPGIVTLPAGARVFDAIAAAGGAEPAAELNSLNLAAVVQDAAKIHVPRAGDAVTTPVAGAAGGAAGGGGGGGTSGSGNSGSGASAGGKLNLNTATAEELDALPKVGPVLAKRIVEWRQQHGPFAAVEDLDAVDGVGPKMMESLLPLVTV